VRLRSCRGVIENNVSTDGQIDVRELRVNAHTIVCGRSAITNRVRASVWAFTHALANVELAVETLFSITPVSCTPNYDFVPKKKCDIYLTLETVLTILFNGRVETMARLSPDGICRGTGPCPSRQGAKKIHAAGLARISKRGDHGGDLATQGTPPACKARAAAIALQ